LNVKLSLVSVGNIPFIQNGFANALHVLLFHKSLIRL